MAAVGCLSPHSHRHLPGCIFLADRLAQTGENATARAGDRKAIGPGYRVFKGGFSVKVIKAIYNFIVGDMVILIGVVLAVVILALIKNVAVLAPVKGISGPFLGLAVLGSLTATLSSEAFSSRR